ncbi:eukaryotic translation initiation factor 4G-like isoform X2 [Prosopis cineraria]|uniref:eukaryotic translation initiation factor 4G-like isoform X2 n=1 Tax=Prosopis cineraria TaxID=364024 RepID=UPI00240F3715|nr:eukaryotic translation initiation factor 4G-like isoform X2 [Prosopis cineraria]
MSFNQSRSDKSDNHYRKSWRSGSFNQQRGSSGTHVKGGGGGAAPSAVITSGSSQPSNRRVNPPPVNSAESNGASTGRTIPNGAHSQQSPGASDAPVTNAVAKSSEPSSIQKSTRVVPKAPTPGPSTVNSDAAAPTTPAKAPEDSSKPFAFQFGSISPGFMNGISIPARTSSAPPNLDEQKRDQACHDSFRPVPSVPTPPKQLPPRNDGVVTDQSNAGEARSVNKVKKEEQVLALPPASQVQKPSVAMTGISMAMPYHHQSQAPVQFGGPNPQIQSQGMPPASLQIPIPLAMGNVAQVQPQVFFPSLQTLPTHPQGIMHQGQNLSFPPQMGPQMSHQLGNMGMNINPQYTQQQGGKFAGPRKATTVRITHPETHEELRLDNDKKSDSHSDGMSSGARNYPNVPSQSQPVQSFATSHPLNYFPSSTYSSGSLFFPPSSVPLSSSHITPNSQQPRFNYPVNQGPQNGGFNNPLSIGSLPVSKTGTFVPGFGETPNLEHSRDSQKVISSGMSGVAHASIKPSGSSGIVDSTITNSGISVKTSESPGYLGASIDAGSTVSPKVSDNFSETSSQQSKPSSDSFVSRSLSKQPAAGSAEKLASTPLMPFSAAVSENSVSVVSNNEGRKKESLSRSNSLKDNQKKTGKRGQSQHQVTSQSPTVVNVPSQAVDSVMVDREVSDTSEKKTKACVATTRDDNSNSTPQALSATVSSDIFPCANEMNIDPSLEGSVRISAEGVGALAIDSLNNHRNDKLESSQQDKLLKMNILEVGDKNERSCEVFKQKSDDIGTKFKQTETDGAKESQVQQRLESQDESTNFRSECDIKGDNLGVPTSNDLDSRDIYLNRNDSTVSNESICANSASTDKNSGDLPEATSKHSKDCSENADSGSVFLPTSISKDRPILEPNKVKTTTKGKKKRREILQKADAAGSTADLYNAYKRPEEKKEVIVCTESKESTSSGSLKQLPKEAAQPDAIATEKDGHDKAEPADWEDAADMSSPKLEVAEKTQQVSDGNELAGKKYSRDFLMKFEEQCIDLPADFKIEDIPEGLMNSNVTGSHFERDSHLSPGRIMDRSGGMSRMDRRGSGHFEEDRWNKVAGRDMRMDGFGGNTGFRHGQGGNFGVLRNPRAQTPLQYAGGILSGPMQSMGNQGIMQKNSPDGERWQRATNYQQRGLIPSPQTPLQMMHKAEKKYEVGKVTDEEQAKQRQLKAILNKLTPQNFEKLFEQVKAVNIDNAGTLTRVISQIFEKALMEPTFCEMYADFCFHLAAELPDFSEDEEKITFKRLLLNKCQEEFERGEREQEEANKDDDGEVKQSNEEREEKRIKARRRMLGNIRLIGELYKKKMLTERIMHECIQKLLGSYQDPDEEDIEALCKLMSTIGVIIDHPKAKEHIDAYFERMKLLSNNMNLSSRVRFMLKDAIDLRKNKWQQKRKVEGPKKIEEVHRDAAQERQAQTGRVGRGPSNTASLRRMPMDFSLRGSSMLSPPITPMGLRGLSAQVRSGGSQDVRQDDRLSYEARNLSIPLPQRPLADDSITLGPQGGLARGMSFRGPAAIPSSPVPDGLPVAADSRRMTSGPNGYSNSSERALYSSREDQTPRYATDRFASATAHDQSAVQERNISYGNRDLRNADRSLERPVATLPPGVQGSAVSKNASLEKVWPEEQLRDMSMAAIKEYYSARDVKEVALCVKDLNSPSYHPSMISQWVIDSFERKDTERDLLAKLLVSLTKSQDGTLSQSQLIQGFEYVLSGLQDAVNDAPRAPEFLGRVFARVVTESVVSLKDIGRLLHEGGEEPGQLLEIGLAADVLGSTLEAIQMEKGDAVLSEIRSNSNLRLETFRPLNSNVSRKLEKYI